MSEESTDERWYVQFDDGKVVLMTLEELDEAFQAGKIHERTHVIQVGETTWLTLAEVAGLDEAEAESETAPAPEVAAPAPSAYPVPQPVPIQSMPQRVPSAYPVPQPVPIQSSPSRVPSAYAVAQAASGYPAPSASYPPVSSHHASMPPLSTAPVVQDLDLDLDLGGPSFAAKKGRTAMGFAAAAVAVLGLGAYGLSQLDQPETPVAAAAPVEAPVLIAPRDQPGATPWRGPGSTTQSGSSATPSKDNKDDERFSEEMKKALLEADKDRAAKKAVAPARSYRRSSSGSSGGLKKGGDANDPLNGKL